MDFTKIASDAVIEKTAAALKANGMNALVVENGAQAKAKALELIPVGSEVMNMTSVTLETLGLSADLNDSGRYNSIRAKFAKMDRKTQGLDMQKMGAAPTYVIGSVHAVTEDGKVMIAAATGSQLPAYAYGSAHVIWIVGAQKIVPDEETGRQRIYEYVLPLESKRANKAYNITTGSAVNKLLIINKEGTPNRITMIIVKESLGF